MLQRQWKDSRERYGSTVSIMLDIIFMLARGRNNASGSRRSGRISRVTGTCRARKPVHDWYFRRNLPDLFPSNCKNYPARGSFAQQIRFTVRGYARFDVVSSRLISRTSLGI